LLEQLHAARGLQLEGDRELVPLPVLRRRHALLTSIACALDAERHALASAIARLDLDDPGAEIREQHGAERHRDDLSQVEHGDVVERLLDAVPCRHRSNQFLRTSAPGAASSSHALTVIARKL